MLNSQSMKTLHVCNVANMAYGFSKLLMKVGSSAEVHCNNLAHIMSQPEWDDLDLDPEAFYDENNFYNNSLELNHYTRPFWYHSDTIWDHNNPIISKFARFIPYWLRVKIKPTYYRLWNRCLFIQTKLAGNEKKKFDLIERTKQIVELSHRYEQRWWVSAQDVMLYAQQVNWLFERRTESDILFGYMYAPITAFILNTNPFISVEIGTIRDIPFENSALGRLLALTYRSSPFLLITNPDGRDHAIKLGISPERFRFIPHPVDNTIYKPNDQIDIKAVRDELKINVEMDLVLFAPARQNWELKGNDKYLKAFAELISLGVKACLIIPGWGQEVARSKKLCKKLGIEKNVQWVKPMSEPRLIKYMQAADVVIDQFQLGVFGLITAKALSCGKPVLTSYNKKIHEWCFVNHPPLLVSSTPQEILNQLLMCVHDKNRLLELSALSREWILENYSNEIIVNALKQSMEFAKKFFNDDQTQHR